jgi:hypothetical protein
VNISQLVQALRRGEVVSIRDAFLRFASRHPDSLGPPGRWPIIHQLQADSRVVLDWDTWTLRAT